MNQHRRYSWPAIAAFSIAAGSGFAAWAHAPAASNITHLARKLARAPLGDVLYDQNATGNTYGAFVNSVVAPPPTLGNTSVGADDFVVADDAGWTVTGFMFNAYGPNDAAPPAAISLMVYADDGNGRPGPTPVCSSPANAVTYDAVNHQITASLPDSCTLMAGTYWIAWSFDNVDLGTGVWGWWGQTTTLHNQPAVWWNSGGNFGTPCTAGWGTFSDCGIYDLSLEDYGFSVLGHVASGSSALQLTLGVTPYAGDPDECGTSTDVAVNVGDQVNLCYTLTNNGSETLAYQSIMDSVDGAVLTYDPTPIGPGESHSYVRTIVATSDTERTASWTGYANLASYAYDDTVTPNFIDISATGTPMGFVPGDGWGNESGGVTAPFPLRFYGRTSTDLCLAIDGLLQFDDPTCIPPSGSTPPPGFSFNQDIPSTTGTEVPTYLAPMWTNLNDVSGDVYVEALGTAPQRTYVVQWNDLESYAIATSTATFEIVFREDSDTIRFEYLSTVFGNDADNGGWATVGVQADPNGLYTKYSYYQPSLQSNSAIEWTFTPAVSASADSDGPVSISAGDPTLAVAQTGITAVADVGGSATRALTIANAGNRDLHWSLAEAPGGAQAHFPKTPRYVAASRSGLDAPAATTFSGVLATPGAYAGPVASQVVRGGFTVPAYGISALMPGLVAFDALNPASTYTPLNNSSDWIYAATFVGNDFSKLYVIIDDSWELAPGTYGTIDTTTGAFTNVGQITGGETRTWGGLAEDPLTGTVYAVNFVDQIGSAGATLYTIDFGTGQATRVGPIDGPGVNPVRYISGIAVSPAGLMYGIDLYGQSLLAIDKTSGAASVIDGFGLDVQYVQDLKFDPQTGDLYWAAFYIDSTTNQPVGEMRVIDPQTAASQAIGMFPAAGEYPFDEMSALAIAKPSVGCSAPGDVPWLSVDPTSGTILADAAAQDVTVTLDATGLSPGLHQATICVFSDDPHHQRVAVPVSFAVSEATPLYDQTITDTDVHAFNNTVVAPPETEGLSAEGADDFVVTENGWSVSGFHFTAYGNNGNPLPPTVNLSILADDGNGRPSTDAVCSVTDLPAIPLDAPENQIGVWLMQACPLSPGTYWVAWSFANVNIASPILGFWGVTSEQHNQPAVWRNPGGMLGTGCSVWSTFDQCPGMFAEGSRDFGFSVYGSPTTIDCADVIFGDGFDGDGGACPAQATRD